MPRPQVRTRGGGTPRVVAMSDGLRLATLPFSSRSPPRCCNLNSLSAIDILHQAVRILALGVVGGMSTVLLEMSTCTGIL